MNDAQFRIKQSKYLLNAGRPRAALMWAKMEVNNRSFQLAAMAQHRAGLALWKLKEFDAALEFFEDAKRSFNHMSHPDVQGLAMLERDIQLLRVERCALASTEREAFVAEALRAVEKAAAALESLPESPRRDLEVVVTRAYLSRIRLLENRFDQQARTRLISDYELIRELRGATKPGYELDALDWLLRYTYEPLVPSNKYVWRQFVLSVRVGNLVEASKLGTTPAYNLAGWAAGKMFR